MTFGKWRIRPRYRWRKYSSVWVDRTEYPEGTVYRAAVGLVQITVMVDCLTDPARKVIADKLLEWFNG